MPVAFSEFGIFVVTYSYLARVHNAGRPR